MSKFEIYGPSNLKGEIEVMGAKNAAMKMIAASILIDGTPIINNVPDISDIQIIIDILSKNGARINRNGHTISINTNSMTSLNPDGELIEKMRGAIVLIGPYLARFGKITLPQPGGCAIGARSIETHLDAFRQIGARISQNNNVYSLELKNLENKTIILKEASVTATENIILVAVKSKARIVIENAAKEPEIIDLINFLKDAGAKISGAGTSTIIIDGVDALKANEYHVIPDRIEAGTFLALSVVTGSHIKIKNIIPQHLHAFINKLTDIGVKLKIGNDNIEVISSDSLKAIDVATAIYPDFPTDLQAPMGLILTQCHGTSLISENLFENRLGYLDELTKMGAKIKIIDKHHAEIFGPIKLSGCEIVGLDLRAGATLILAGLAAEGKTTISNAEIVDRGYEKIEQRLIKLGAKIRRIE